MTSVESDFAQVPAVSAPAGTRWGSALVAWVLFPLAGYGLLFLPLPTVVIQALIIALIVTHHRYARNRLFFDERGFSEFTYRGKLVESAFWKEVRGYGRPSMGWFVDLPNGLFFPSQKAPFFAAVSRYFPDLLRRSSGNIPYFLSSRPLVGELTMLWFVGSVIVIAPAIVVITKGALPRSEGTLPLLLIGVFLWSLTWVDADNEGLIVRRVWGKRVIAWSDLAGWQADARGGQLVLTSGQHIALNLLLTNARTLERVVREVDSLGKFAFA